jgi:flagellar hook assembly protein FlgD
MDISPIQQTNDGILGKDLHLFDIKDALLPKSRDYDGDWFFETAKYPELIFYMKSAEEYKLEISDKDGKVVKTFEARGIEGINRIEWDLVKAEAKYSKSAYKGGTSLFSTGTYRVMLSSIGATESTTFIINK